MTLPPLPEPHLVVFDAALQSPIDGWTRSQVEAYARAAVEAERAAIIARCESLIGHGHRDDGSDAHLGHDNALETVINIIRARGATGG